VEGLDVLPVLLQQGHEEVHGQVDVLSQFLLGHLNVSNGNVQAENLLHLELDGGLQVEHLCLDVIGVGDQGGELARLVKSGSQQPGNLLDQSVGAEEGVVGLGEVLHLLLVLVQLLEVVSGHAGKTFLLGLVAVSLVSEDTHAELLARNILQPKRLLLKRLIVVDSMKAFVWKDSGSVSEFG